VKFLVVSDCEEGLPALPAASPDLVVCCGDVPRDVLERVVARYGVPCLGVLGNHDPALAPPLLGEVHLRVMRVPASPMRAGGVTFGGFGGSWRYKPRGHHLYDDGEVEALLVGFPRVDVFVAHNPPAGVHDAPDDVHNGFAAFRRYIEEQQPALFLHGHVHRSAETTVGRTRVLATVGARVVEY
jgi:Icc-related predicted phosphoesterase